ncbi:MAG: hypothetical protein Q4G36_08435 [Paracoccus sp. (in: a-proteobacteria)]|nr:hypothetical protein [Paracoccus sp. (in: a-proteobacteria)]
MYRAILLSVLLLTALLQGAAAEPSRHRAPPAPQWAQDVLPLPRIMATVAEEVQGELLRADLTPPEPLEFAMGVNLVHELRILSRERHLLLVRLDAQSGEILEIIGRGIAAARQRDD